MKIVRIIKGKEYTFELTSQELYFAFLEKEAEFDRQDVKNVLDETDDEEFLEKYGCTREEAEAEIEEIASKKRRNIDKYNMDWRSATEKAIKQVLVEGNKI